MVGISISRPACTSKERSKPGPCTCFNNLHRGARYYFDETLRDRLARFLVLARHTLLLIDHDRTPFVKSASQASSSNANVDFFDSLELSKWLVFGRNFVMEPAANFVDSMRTKVQS